MEAFRAAARWSLELKDIRARLHRRATASDTDKYQK
jgi:hypothetical protein